MGASEGAAEAAEGGVFSMVGPTAGGSPIVAYDFTRSDPAATLAANVTAANLSGDSDNDLEPLNTPIWLHGSEVNTAGDRHFREFLHPVGAGEGGGILITAADELRSVISPPDLRILGGLTVEWLGMIPVTAALEGAALVDFNGTDELEINNRLYLLNYDRPANIINYQHESGAGLNADATIANGVPNPGSSAIGRGPFLLTMVRGAAGGVQLYNQGRRVTSIPVVTGGPGAALPTGGSSSKLWFRAAGAGSTIVILLGVRIFDYAFTAAQVLESYKRTWFGAV